MSRKKEQFNSTPLGLAAFDVNGNIGTSTALINVGLEKVEYQNQILDVIKQENELLKKQLQEALSQNLIYDAAAAASPSLQKSRTGAELTKSQQLITDLENKLTKCETALDDVLGNITNDAKEKDKYLKSVAALVDKYIATFDKVTKEDFKNLAKSTATIVEKQNMLVANAFKLVEHYKEGDEEHLQTLATTQAADYIPRRKLKLDNDNKCAALDATYNCNVTKTDLAIGDTFFPDEQGEEENTTSLAEFIKNFREFQQTGSATVNINAARQEKVMINGANVPPKMPAATKIPTISVGTSKKKAAAIDKITTDKIHLDPENADSQLQRSVSSSTFVVTLEDQAKSSVQKTVKIPPKVSAVKKNAPMLALPAMKNTITKRDGVVKRSARRVFILTKEDKSVKGISQIFNDHSDKRDRADRPKPTVSLKKDDLQPSTAKTLVVKTKKPEERPEIFKNSLGDFKSKHKEATTTAAKNNLTAVLPGPSSSAICVRKPLARRLFSDEPDSSTVTTRKKRSSLFYVV